MESKLLNILVVDDDDVDVMNIRRAFKKANITNPVWVASNGVEALAMLRDGTVPTRNRLVLLDLNMPQMNGIEATRIIRALPAYADTPILAMTANAFAEDRQVCLDAGMDDHIGKPVDPDKLYETLLQWLDKRGN